MKIAVDVDWDNKKCAWCRTELNGLRHVEAGGNIFCENCFYNEVKFDNYDNVDWNRCPYD